MAADPTTHKLVLEIEVPGFYVDGTEEPLTGSGAEYGLTLLDIVTEEWMRPDVGLTLVSIPGEKTTNSDFEVHAMDGRIVGARIETVTNPVDFPITEERPRDAGTSGAAT